MTKQHHSLGGDFEVKHESHPSRRWVLAAMMVVVILLNGLDRGVSAQTPDNLPEGVESVRVVNVVDGDTVIVQRAAQTQILDLIGVDAPEVAASGAPAECYAYQATQFLKEQVSSAENVWIEQDQVEQDTGG